MIKLYSKINCGLVPDIMVSHRNAVAFIIIHPQISKRVTAKIILVSPASILVVNDYKGNYISGPDLYMFGPSVM